MFTDPSIADFKAYFVRDFPYGATPTTVNDADITSGLTDAGVNINQGLFATQAQYSNGFLLLSAHYMTMNLRASSQGIAGQFSWLQSSRGVGSVSEALAIPPRILENPYFAYLSKTNYGMKYLSLVLPQLTGQIFTVRGTVQP